MKYSLISGGIVLLYLFCFSINSYSGTIVIDGDIDNLNDLSSTKYGSDENVLLFIEQNKSREIHDLSNLTNFVFNDSDCQKFAIEFLDELPFGCAECIITISTTSKYDFFLEFKKNELQEIISNIPILIDGREIILNSVYGLHLTDKIKNFILLSEIQLEKGKHKIQINNQHKKEGIDFKIFMVNKNARKNLEKKIWLKINDKKNTVSYLFNNNEGEFYVP